MQEDRDVWAADVSDLLVFHPARRNGNRPRMRRACGGGVARQCDARRYMKKTSVTRMNEGTRMPHDQAM